MDWRGPGSAHTSAARRVAAGGGPPAGRSGRWPT